MQSINEASFLQINNTKLFTLIKAENINNPILLIIHGGSSQTANFAWFNKELEKDFIVVYFDQRAEGKSTFDTIDTSSLTLKNYIEDIHQLTNYLKNRFKKEKIYLLGHSMGSLLGMKTIEKYPNDYISYIAVSQYVDALKNDNIAYDLLQNDFRVNKKQLKDIQRITKNNINKLNLKRRTKELLLLAIKHGGMLYKRNFFNVFKILIFPIFIFKEYNFKDKLNALTQNKQRLIFYYESSLEDIIKIDIPIYFIHGKEDLVINYNLTKEYFEKIKAPKKEFITFEKSAHFPQFEEAKRFNTLIISRIKK